MRMPGGASETRLLNFLHFAQSAASAEKLAEVGSEIDANLGHLLKTFPGEQFWSAVGKLSSVDAYPPDEKRRLYQLDFESVDYPFATAFALQLKTWLGALGCTEVYSDVIYKYSKLSQDNIFDVRSSYKSGRLAVFVGAGISRQVGLPLWEDLLDRLTEIYSARAGADVTVLRKLQTRDLRERARWLKHELGVEFQEAVRQALFREAYRNGLSTSRIIDALVRMEFLRAVCSYNYDDLLERQGGARFRAIASAQDWYGREHTPVYHVHGLLPYIGAPRGELVLSEDDYLELANNPQHWANIVQVNLLRECTSLLIGISCADPNLRRILHLVGDKKAGDTYIIQKMEDIDGVEPDLLRAWSTSKEFDRDCFAALHLRTIWIHDHDEVPDILESCISDE
jgi:NAD-dependent SIR2 family protein deacetylase